MLRRLLRIWGLIELSRYVGGCGAGGNGAMRPSPAAYYGGGGGGAGGYLEKLDFTLPIGFYEIRVGSGGIAVVNASGSPGYNR